VKALTANMSKLFFSHPLEEYVYFFSGISHSKEMLSTPECQPLLSFTSLSRSGGNSRVRTSEASLSQHFPLSKKARVHSPSLVPGNSKGRMTA